MVDILIKMDLIHLLLVVPQQVVERVVQNTVMVDLVLQVDLVEEHHIQEVVVLEHLVREILVV